MDTYERMCRDHFNAIHEKLEEIDTAIRGNGKVGLVTRVDRLEQTERVRGRVMWTVVVACIGTLVTVVVKAVLDG